MSGYLIIDSYYKITGEDRWVMYGYCQPVWCTFKGATIDKNPLDALLPSTYGGRTVYMTKRCWDSLSEPDKNVARGRIQGVVTHITSPTPSTIIECFKGACREILSPTPDDPCKDVSCPDKCIGVDKYDQVCQDGICVRGTLIETNSVHCGYVTPSPEPDDPVDPTPSDREGDYPVTNGNHTDMIILVIVFGILFAAASRYF